MEMQLQQWEGEKEIVHEHSEHQAQIYGELLTCVHHALFTGTPSTNDVARKDLGQCLSDFSQRGMALAWGSNDVKQAFLNFKLVTDAYATSPSLLMLGDQFWALGDLLMAILDDLGYRDLDLGREELLTLFIANMDSVLGPTVAA